MIFFYSNLFKFLYKLNGLKFRKIPSFLLLPWKVYRIYWMKNIFIHEGGKKIKILSKLWKIGERIWRNDALKWKIGPVYIRYQIFFENWLKYFCHSLFFTKWRFTQILISLTYLFTKQVESWKKSSIFMKIATLNLFCDQRTKWNQNLSKASLSVFIL